ncbi:thiamine pyrophosphate-binding protein [Actinoplanes campanulatus]|nr:thiamine pyrophosphate-binding protein [Actinoplanes campanulatus]
MRQVRWRTDGGATDLVGASRLPSATFVRHALGYSAVMETITSQVLISRLADWGVDTVFGLPGDGINGLMEGLRRNADRVRFVLVHHEEAAAFMATAYAKATGRIGVCLATSGPGGIHLANGLYDAALDHAPVLAITGMQETSVLGTAYQQEVDLTKLYADVAVYNQLVVNPQQLPAVPGRLYRRTGHRRRGALLRLRHHRHLGGPPLHHPRRARVQPVGQPGDDGAGPAVRDRHPARVPRPPGDRAAG